MNVFKFYLENFSQLSPDKQFHFVTRIKNWQALGNIDLSDDDLNFIKKYIRENELSHDLISLLHDNDYSAVNSVELRRPYFEKYKNLYAIEGTLFRVHHLLYEYDVDLTLNFLRLVPEDSLKSMAADLRNDPDAIAILSTYAINVLCLLDRQIFKISDDIYMELLNVAHNYHNMHPDYPDSLYIYLITHIIICDSNFYKSPIPKNHLKTYHQALAICEKLITENHQNISYDVQLEFLVCCRLTGFESHIKDKIAKRCHPTDQPFVTDPQKTGRNSLNGAEHRNVLYIMSGLDN